MKALSGKQLTQLKADELAKRMRGRFPVHIDVGTGSGRLMLKHSRLNPGGYYIGLDPCAGGMGENAVKAAKRGKKPGQDNLLYVVGSIECMPEELAGIADAVSVILPWGSLRDGIVKGDALILNNLRGLGKKGSTLDILIGYDGRIEPRELEKRGLPVLSCEYLAALGPIYRSARIELRSIKTVENGALKLIESDWAKKLAFGKARVTYRLDCVYI